MTGLFDPLQPLRESLRNSGLELANEDVDLDSFVVLVQLVEELDSAGLASRT